jgi:hypothetical protein
MLARLLRRIGPRLTPQEALDGDRIHVPHESPRTRALPPGHQYIGGCGTRATRRHQRQRCAPVYRLKDAASLHALARLRVAVQDDPDPLAAEWNLAYAALEASRGVGTTWAEAMHHLLNRFEERAG